MCRLEHGKPGPDRVGGDAEISAEVRKIEQLRAPRGQHAKETVKLREVADLTQGTDIALQVGLHIASVPEPGIPPGMGGEFRETSTKKARPQFAPRGAVRDRRRSLLSFPGWRIEWSSRGLVVREGEQM